MLSPNAIVMLLVLVLSPAFASSFAVPREFKDKFADDWKQQRKNFDWTKNLKNPFLKNQESRSTVVEKKNSAAGKNLTKGREFSLPKEFQHKKASTTPLPKEFKNSPENSSNVAEFSIPEGWMITLKQPAKGKAVDKNSLPNETLEKSKSISFAHANVCGWEKRKDVIFKYATENAVKIFSISEHHIPAAQKTQVGKHQEYNWEGSYREKKWGGSGLLIHKSIQYKQISKQFDFQMEKTAIEFRFANESYCVFSIYLPQRSDVEINQMEQLLMHLLENRDRWQNIILLGDFNAWNMAWGNTNNKRGIRLFDAIIKSQFVVEKLPTPTRIGTKNQKNTFVDLVITNRDDGVIDLKVGQKVSDHRLLSFTFTREPRQNNLIITEKGEQFSFKIAEMLLKQARLTIADKPKQNTNVEPGVALEQLQTCRTIMDITALQHIFLWNAIFAFSQIFLFFQMFSNNFKNL